MLRVSRALRHPPAAWAGPCGRRLSALATVRATDASALLHALSTQGFAVIPGALDAALVRDALGSVAQSVLGEGASGSLRAACASEGVLPGYHQYALAPNAGARAETRAFRVWNPSCTPRELREAYTAHREWPESMMRAHLGSRGNLWPDELTRATATALWQGMAGLADELLLALEGAAGAASYPAGGGGRGAGWTGLSDSHRMRDYVLEAKRYVVPGAAAPGDAEAEPGPGAWLTALPAHSDLTTLTLLAAGPSMGVEGGLEVWDWARGQWEVAAGLGAGDVVVNVGEFGEALSGGRLRSTPHRVRLRRGSQTTRAGQGRAWRESVVLFAAPDAHTNVRSARLPPSKQSLDRAGFASLPPARYGIDHAVWDAEPLVGDHLPL